MVFLAESEFFGHGAGGNFWFLAVVGHHHFLVRGLVSEVEQRGEPRVSAHLGEARGGYLSDKPVAFGRAIPGQELFNAIVRKRVAQTVELVANRAKVRAVVVASGSGAVAAAGAGEDRSGAVSWLKVRAICHHHFLVRVSRA